MKKGKAAKKAAIAVVTAVAVGGVSVGGYYGIRQAQKTTEIGRASCRERV